MACLVCEGSWGLTTCPPGACRVDISKAVGRISAELLCPYPPGIPLVFPGERISAQDVRALRAVLAQNGRIKGPADPHLKRVQVVLE